MQNDPPFIPPPSKGGVQYRLYFLAGDGHISHAHEFHAPDDATAIRIAEGWREGQAIELWSPDRKVKAWP